MSSHTLIPAQSQATDGAVILHSTQLEQRVPAHVLEAASYRRGLKPFLRTIFQQEVFLAPTKNPHFSEDRASVDFLSKNILLH